MSAWFERRLDGWPDVDGVREALRERLAARLPAAEADLVALAAHELAENGLKYSVARPVRLAVELGADEVRVTAESRPDPAELRTLVDELEALGAAGDPLAYYRDKMAASLERSDGRAGLGLVRIACEANMRLRHELCPDGNLRLIASHPLRAKGAP